MREIKRINKDEFRLDLRMLTNREIRKKYGISTAYYYAKRWEIPLSKRKKWLFDDEIKTNQEAQNEKDNQ
jgi:hypothetical protein